MSKETKDTMAAKLYSLPAFKVAQKEGFDAAYSAKFARHVATEMAQDGDLALDEKAGLMVAAMQVVAKAPKPERNPDRGPEHPEVRDLGGNYAYAVGPKYKRDLDVKDIAKLVRQDIKDAIKGGELPKGKYGVRISRFAGGCSLDGVR